MSYIPGGIYTVSNADNIWYVFIGEDDKYFWFYRQQIGSYRNLAVSIQDYLNFYIDKDFFKSMFNDVIHFKHEKFEQKCDGYLGQIEDGKLDILLEIWEAKTPKYGR